MKRTIFILILSFFHLSATMGQISKSPAETECSNDFAIYKFKIQDKGSAYKLKWKVVVGRDIEYKAKPGVGVTWNWELGSGNCSSYNSFWNLQSSPSGSVFKDRSKKNVNAAIIPNSSLPSNNSDFGDTHGLVKASVDSDQTCIQKNGTNAKVKVFFEKDATNPHENVPNWFFYWKQSPKIQNLLTIPGIALYNLDPEVCDFNDFLTEVTLDLIYDPSEIYDPTPSATNTYGFCTFNRTYWHLEDTYPDCNGGELGVVLADYSGSNVINITQACGFSKGKYHCNQSAGNHKGIYAFYTTVVHEVEHAKITCDVWNFTHTSDPAVKSGYSSTWDMDHDGYKDIWENEHPEAMAIGFETETGLPDADKYNSDYANCYCKFTPEGNSNPLSPCSAGTMYEEKRCRDKETTITLEDIDDDDWSFDPTDIIQGKQWNSN